MAAKRPAGASDLKYRAERLEVLASLADDLTTEELAGWGSYSGDRRQMLLTIVVEQLVQESRALVTLTSRHARECEKGGA